MNYKTKIILISLGAFVIVGLVLFTPQFDGFKLKGFADNIHQICYPISLWE